MTPDPVDAALDVWFGQAMSPQWRTSPNAENYRARMRRVLDAHDALKRDPRSMWAAIEAAKERK